MRQFVRCPTTAPTKAGKTAATLREALDADGAVEIYDEGREPPHAPALLLQVRGIAVSVIGPNGIHLATYADPVAGVWEGFRRLDDLFPLPPPARPRRRRPRREGARP